jgi:hypothetical protein
MQLNEFGISGDGFPADVTDQSVRRGSGLN